MDLYAENHAYWDDSFHGTLLCLNHKSWACMIMNIGIVTVKYCDCELCVNQCIVTANQCIVTANHGIVTVSCDCVKIIVTVNHGSVTVILGIVTMNFGTVIVNCDCENLGCSY